MIRRFTFSLILFFIYAGNIMAGNNSPFSLNEEQQLIAFAIIVPLVIFGLILEHTKIGKKYFKYYFVLIFLVPVTCLIFYMAYEEKSMIFIIASIVLIFSIFSYLKSR